jgi:hypothetical protein
MCYSLSYLCTNSEICSASEINTAEQREAILRVKLPTLHTRPTSRAMLLLRRLKFYMRFYCQPVRCSCSRTHGYVGYCGGRRRACAGSRKALSRSRTRGGTMCPEVESNVPARGVAGEALGSVEALDAQEAWACRCKAPASITTRDVILSPRDVVVSYCLP